MDLISVIVPIYKVEKYLSECVDSILNQTYENFEIILVDDGSPDNSGRICDEYAEKDKRIKVIHKENGGVSSARNIGLDNAKGEYIAFVDSDDIVNERYLELMYEKLLETKANICFCKMKRFNTTINIDIKDDHSEEFDFRRRDRDDFLSDFFAGKFDYSSCTALYKKSSIGSGRFNEKVKNNEDFLFTLNSILNCEKISSIPVQIYYYRTNETSVTQNYIKGLLENNLIVYKELCELYENDNIPKKCLGIYACRSSYFLLKNELKYKNFDYKKRIKEIKMSPFYKQFKLKNILLSFPRFLSKAKVSLFWLKIKLHLC